MSDFTLFGRPARFVIEMETENGNRIQVPIVDGMVISPPGRDRYGEIRVPFMGNWIQQLVEEADDMEKRGA